MGRFFRRVAGGGGDVRKNTRNANDSCSRGIASQEGGGGFGLDLRTPFLNGPKVAVGLGKGFSRWFFWRCFLRASLFRNFSGESVKMHVKLIGVITA